MHTKSPASLFLLLVLFAGIPAAAAAQSWTPPSAEERCPSKWGPNDERGAANHMTPENVLRAVKLVRSGETIELGHTLAMDMPLPFARRFDVHLKRTGGPMGTNRRYTNEELVITEIGQVGTQMDAFTHQSIDGLFYNCVPTEEIVTRNGFTRLGIDRVGTLITRGVLVDVAGLKGVDMLAEDYEITVEDLEAALARQDVGIQAGDAVLVHTGWGKLWGVDNDRYLSGYPGLGLAAAQWLLGYDAMILGADTAPVEIAPNPDEKLSLPVHQLALVVHGVYLLENLKLDELAAKNAYEFALIVQPLKIRGGTGSTVAPVAVR